MKEIKLLMGHIEDELEDHGHHGEGKPAEEPGKDADKGPDHRPGAWEEEEDQ